MYGSKCIVFFIEDLKKINKNKRKKKERKKEEDILIYFDVFL